MGTILLGVGVMGIGTLWALGAIKEYFVQLEQDLTDVSLNERLTQIVFWPLYTALHAADFAVSEYRVWRDHQAIRDSIQEQEGRTPVTNGDAAASPV